MPHDDRANLLHLTRFRQRTAWLQVQDLGYSTSGIDVMIALDPLLETESVEQRAAVFKSEVCICCAIEHLDENPYPRATVSRVTDAGGNWCAETSFGSTACGFSNVLCA